MTNIDKIYGSIIVGKSMPLFITMQIFITIEEPIEQQ
jgi:hypothetical protein